MSDITQKLRSKFQGDNIPTPLKEQRCWLVWKVGTTKPDGKFRKIPYYPTTMKTRGPMSTVEDREALGTFDEAIAAFDKHNDLAGVGIALLPENNIVAIDIDNFSSDEPESDKTKLIRELVRCTYGELSPSGKGLRFIFTGQARGGQAPDGKGYEIFHEKGFVTITGISILKNWSFLPINLLPDAMRERLEELVHGQKAQEGPKSSIPEDKALRMDLRVTDETIRDLESAIDAISPARVMAYDPWWNAIMALASLKLADRGEDGLRLAHRLSKRCGEGYDPDELNSKWKGIKHRGEKSYSHIFKLAEKDGWENPWAKPEIGRPIAGGFDRFVLNTRINAMKENMLNDVPILGRIALLGQSTVFYAKPNSGKTLLTIWLLREAIAAKRLDGSKVFYINADDNYKGLVSKGDLANEIGFNLLAPGHEGFDASTMVGILAGCCDEGTAKGTVVILDTTKHFTSLMDKTKVSEFGKSIRQFVSHGGTVIMLAHVNKHPGQDGKLIYEGTADMVNDVDCAYVLESSDNDFVMERVVEFNCIKSRGDVLDRVSYSYSFTNGLPYVARLNSIKELTEDESREARTQRMKDEARFKDQETIDAIRNALQWGELLKSELVDSVRGETRISRRRIVEVIDRYLDQEGCWSCVKEGTNGSKYRRND